MGQRHKARCAVLDLLYSIEISGNENIGENLDYCASLHKLSSASVGFVKRLFSAVVDNLDDIDSVLKKIIRNWDIDRLAIVDKNILRLGVGEIKYLPEIPVKVAIDEAIELAKKYGSADSARFVNGVLDAICSDEGLAMN